MISCFPIYFRYYNLLCFRTTVIGVCDFAKFISLYCYDLIVAECMKYPTMVCVVCRFSIKRYVTFNKKKLEFVLIIIKRFNNLNKLEKWLIKKNKLKIQPNLLIILFIYSQLNTNRLIFRFTYNNWFFEQHVFWWLHATYGLRSDIYRIDESNK